MDHSKLVIATAFNLSIRIRITEGEIAPERANHIKSG